MILRVCLFLCFSSKWRVLSLPALPANAYVDVRLSRLGPHALAGLSASVLSATTHTVTEQRQWKVAKGHCRKAEEQQLSGRCRV